MATAATTAVATAAAAKPSSSSTWSSEPNNNSNNAATKPFHLLMVTDDDNIADTEQRVRLEHPKLRRDYLSQRYLALESIQNYQQQQQLQQQQLQQQQQQQHGGKKTPAVASTTTATVTATAVAVATNVAAPPKEKHPFWSGASNVERSLVSCCRIPTKEHDVDGTNNSSAGDDDNDMFSNTVPGALERDKILHFVGLLAVKCTSLGSRALGLAILERSWEADQKADMIMRMMNEGDHDSEEAEADAEDGDGDDSAYEESSPAVSSSPPARKRLRRNDDDNRKQPAGNKKGQKIATQAATTTTAKKPPRPPLPQSQSDCLVMSFLMAGGLRILNHWLGEALTPIPGPKAPDPTAAFIAVTRNSSHAVTAKTTTSTTTANDKPSPFGPLLLPLLSFLAQMPFDQGLVKQSKINKRIRQLSKDVDAIVHQAQEQRQQQQYQQQQLQLQLQQHQQYSNFVGGGGYGGNDGFNTSSISTGVDETLTDPRTGGLSVLKVQDAVNTLKSTWVEKQKASASAPSPPPPRPINPFKSLKDRLSNRLKEVQDFESGTGPEPSWMAAAEAAAKAAAAAAAARAAASTCPVKRKKHETQMAEMARREREKERQERMKGDIRKVKEERDKLLEKLRKLKHKQVVQEEQATHARSDSNRKRVKWKDGLGAASLQRKRDQLEEVFVFSKEDQQDAAAASSSFSSPSSPSSQDNTETSTMQSNEDSSTAAMDETLLLESSSENASPTEETEGELHQDSSE